MGSERGRGPTCGGTRRLLWAVAAEGLEGALLLAEAGRVSTCPPSTEGRRLPLVEGERAGPGGRGGLVGAEGGGGRGGS